MKKTLFVILTFCLVLAINAAETIYRGNSKEAKDVICYFQSGKFFSDAERKTCIYAHPGNRACKGDGPATSANAIYRFMGDKIYKGDSVKKEDALATIVVTKTNKGNAVNAKIYGGFVVARDHVRKIIPGGEEITSYNVTRDAVNVEAIPVMFTVAEGKIYKGDSVKPEDCILTFTGAFNGSRLLFMVFELLK